MLVRPVVMALFAWAATLVKGQYTGDGIYLWTILWDAPDVIHSYFLYTWTGRMRCLQLLIGLYRCCSGTDF